MRTRSAIFSSCALLVALAPAIAFSPTAYHAEHPSLMRELHRDSHSSLAANVEAKASAEESPIDLSHALPGKELGQLPSSAQQLQSLSTQLQQGKPLLADAKQKSEKLASQAKALHTKLIATAAHIEDLERQKVAVESQIAELQAEDDRLSIGFARDRVAVTRLFAVLERLQHDMPPALAMRPDDALAAVRGSMLVGASLPPIYAQAAQLSRRIDALKRTREALEQQRATSAQTSKGLRLARAELDNLLGQKERQAAGAAQDYGTLKVRLAEIAQQAGDFEALLARVEDLRQEPGHSITGQNVVTVTARNRGSIEGLARNSLLVPVVGTLVDKGDSSNPGLTYATMGGAQVIAPADGKVLYAGPYHKDGQVLIMEITTGYDLVLAGMERLTVKLSDQLLAGEPVGTMPQQGQAKSDNRLYFELRHGDHGQSPAPWLSSKLRPGFGKVKRT